MTPRHQVEVAPGKPERIGAVGVIAELHRRRREGFAQLAGRRQADVFLSVEAKGVPPIGAAHHHAGRRWQLARSGLSIAQPSAARHAAQFAVEAPGAEGGGNGVQADRCRTGMTSGP